MLDRPDLMTTRQVLQYLQISRPTLRHYLIKMDLIPVGTYGKSYVFKKEDVDVLKSKIRKNRLILFNDDVQEC
jgi:predicted site-specific integrase-resolvase